MTDQLLTVKEAADRLHVSAMSVYRLVYGGELSFVPVGTGTKRPRIRIKEAVLQAWIDKRAAAAIAV